MFTLQLNLSTMAYLEKLNNIILRRECSHNLDTPKLTNFDEIKCLLQSSSIKWLLSFQNEIFMKDVSYIGHKTRQLKKQNYKKVLNGCYKVLQSNGNYLWAYLIAGATCLKYEKFYQDGFFYFSQVVLLNPNCSTAWACLSKYLKGNPYIENVIFDSVFSGLLRTETNSEKWCNIIHLILELSDGMPERKPLELLSPYIFSHECNNHAFLVKTVANYVLEHLDKSHQLSEIELGIEAFKRHYHINPDISFLKEILSFTFYNNIYSQFNILSHSIMNDIYLQDVNIGPKFFKSVSFLMLWTNYLFGSELVQNFSDIFPEQVRIKRKHFLRYFCLINLAFEDYRRSHDNYLKVKEKGRQQRIPERFIGIWSSIKLGLYNSAWDEVLDSSKFLKSSMINESSYGSLTFENSFCEVLLYLLTHGPSINTRKLGVMLCIKLVKLKEASIMALYCGCIGCIGLGEVNLLMKFLSLLLKLGAINEVFYLKALFDQSNSNTLLKELAEFCSSYVILAQTSYNSEKESKAFKAICKASVLVPYNSVLYEWLGIYFFERGNYEKSEKYFEIALFYNPVSWTAINYYSSLLAKHNPDASKIFLDLYRSGTVNRYSCSHLIAFKAGLFFLKYHSHKFDIFKACENFRYGMRCTRKNRHFRELLGESYSLYGMVGVGVKWLSDCYVACGKRNIYAGSQLGKLYLFTRGVERYANMLRMVLCKGGLECFVSLHNASHAFLLKSMYLLSKNKLHLSQIFCQKSLFISARALSISPHYPATWKILGDALCICGHLNHSKGFLFVPHWLLPSTSQDKIVLIRRFQALRLAIRCYYAALSLPSSFEMKASLWNSIAFTYKRISYLCSNRNSRQILHLSINCNLEALKENVKDCLSWNSLGVLLFDLGTNCSTKFYKHSYSAFTKSVQLSTVIRHRLISTSNTAFLFLAEGDYEKAYNLFLAARGLCPSLDFPWIGQVFLNFINKSDIKTTLKNMVFVYKLTHHFPKIKILFTYLLLLSHYLKKHHISLFCKKLIKFCECGIFSFNECLLSSIVNKEKKKPQLAQQDLMFALRTCGGLKYNGLDEYNTAVHELSLLQSDDRYRLLLSKVCSSSIRSTLMSYSFYKNEEKYNEVKYLSFLKHLSYEKNIVNRRTIFLVLSLINYEAGCINAAKYYFLKAEEVIKQDESSLMKNIPCDYLIGTQ